ncbi:MAG: HAMP domain-containing protein, partial [Spirochaetota bacterium]
MRKSIRAKINIYVCVSILGAVIISSGFFLIKYRDAVDGDISFRLAAGSRVAAAVIDFESLSQLREPEFRQSETFTRTLVKLKDIEQSFEFSSLYLCIRENGRTVITWDSGDNIVPEEDDTFMTEYADAPARLDDAFTGGNPVTAEYTDQFGSFRSVFYPVKDSGGKVIGVIGADYDIASVRSSMRSSYIYMAILLFVGVIISISVLTFLRVSLTGPIIKIIGDIRSISESYDLTRRVDIKGVNEISALAGSFNSFIEKSAENVRSIDEMSAHLASASVELSEISMIFTSTTQSQAESSNDIVQTISSITELINRIVSLAGEQFEIFASQRMLIGDLCSGIKSVSGQADRTMQLSASVADQAKVGEDSLTSMNRSMDLVVK